MCARAGRNSLFQPAHGRVSRETVNAFTGSKACHSKALRPRGPVSAPQAAAQF